jgi:capsular polysaccharide biosynthesis protein
MKSNNNYTKTITSNEQYENTYKPIIKEARKIETLQSNFEPL